MANPLMGMMGGSALAQGAGINMQAIQQAKQMMNMFKAMKNPQQALMAAAQQNPQVASVMQMLNGRNPEEVFREECRKHGADPDQIINMLKG